MYDREPEIKFPLTIEKQLERYYMSEQHTERHAVLWHTWNQNRRWITQLLQITLCSYPSYSKHDESHAQSVLHNIEMILGEERIAELSASDCFVLLHTVYIHDIGMCITHQDREDILKNRAFIDMISELEGYEESPLHHAIMALQKTEYSYEDEEDWVKRAEKLYLDKLEVYYALIQLIGDFRRREHGEKSKERLYDWVKQPERLGSGFSLAGMPQRIFLTIANCARMHTHPDFDAIMELPQEDDGYVSDYIHPRFISVLLQLGDLLDMDNNRFHPLMQMCMGSIPEISQQHYEKHMAIRKLHIRPDKIEIEADCDTQEALRLVRRECDMLKSILKDAGYSWAVICPPGYKGALPTIESVNLYMQGKRIPEDLVTIQFKISQQKAFSILEGANVYPAPFVFIREFLQNALDATKLQYWNDCISTAEYYKNKGIERKDSPYDLEQYASTDNYPIEIDMEIQKKTPDGKISYITKEDIEELDSGKEVRSIYGVKVLVKDFGTGIDKDSILNISKERSSRKKDRKIIESMPEWLRPTVEFGIGLKSAFLLVGNFSCYTRTRNGERYEITFGSGSSLRYDGYINVKPVEDNEMSREDTYGTCFEIFVPYSKKILHQDCLKAWNGEDPFSEEYEKRRPLRHAAELIAQMSIYLNDLVGELLFPLHLNIVKCKHIDIPIKDNLKNILIKWKDREKDKTKYIIEDKKSEKDKEDKKEREWISNKKSWIFYKEKVQNDPSVIYEEVGNDIYLLDCKSARLHIWSGDMNAFLTISAKNLLRYEKGEKVGLKIYYKGIELQTNHNLGGNIFIEYIDIKGDLQRELLNLSRKGFTDKGNKYFEEVINPGLQKSIHNVLKALEKDEKKRINRIGEELRTQYDDLIKMIELDGELSENSLETFCLHIISSLVLIYLANCSEFNMLTVYGIGMEEKFEVFDKLIKEISSLRSVKYYNEAERRVYNDLQKYSLFFNIHAYDENMLHSGQTDIVSLLDFFNPQRQFAILQIRESTMDRWCSYLIVMDKRKEAYKFLEDLIVASNKKQKDCDIVNRWVNRLIKNACEKSNEDEDFKQQFLLNWILKNIPTIAMLSDKTGNVRINILSIKIFPYIYINDEFKFLILNRMIEKYKKDGTERFSTIAWQNQEYLICDNIPFSAYFVKRGSLAKKSYYKVVFPFSGQKLCHMQTQINAILQGEFVQNIYKVVDALNIQKYLQSFIKYDFEVSREIKENEELQEYKELLPDLRRRLEQGNVLLDIYETFSDTIEMERRNKGYLVKSISESVHLLKYDNKQIVFWHKMYLMFVSIYLQRSNGSPVNIESFHEMIKSLNMEKEYEKLCMTIDFFVSDNWKSIVSKYVEERLDAVEYKDSNRTRIIDFINQNAKYPISKENIEICYNNFEKEIILLFQKSVQKEMESEIRKVINIWLPTNINR